MSSASSSPDLVFIEQYLAKIDAGKPDFSAFIGEDGDREERPRHQFKTPGLMEFLRDHAHDFEAADWMIQTFGEENVRRSHGDGACDFQCPNEGGHTNQDPTQTAFHVKNASAGENGFAMWCLTDGCQQASGKDRAWYLDQACVQAGVSHARELRIWCPSASDEELARLQDVRADAAGKAAADNGSIADLIGRVTVDSPAGDIDLIIRGIAARGSEIEQEKLLLALRANSGLRIMTLRSQLKAALKRRKSEEKLTAQRREREHEEAGGSDEGEGSVFRKPVPRDLARTDRIYLDWGADVVKRAAVERMKFLNEQTPVLFQRVDGSIVKIIRPGGELKFKQMRGENWSSTLQDMLSFWRTDRTGEEENVPVPVYVVTYFSGDTGIEWPPIVGFTRVPVFGRDGSLRTEKGYDAELQMWVEPDDDYTCPEGITPEDVEWAKNVLLGNALVDFPFSDKFDGADDTPIYTDARDKTFDKEHPIPNWDRGRSSRANCLAMILQPFVRAMIVGPTPAYHIDKSAAGTGAGYLADVLHTIFEGKRCVATPYSDHNEEVKKTITAGLRDGSNIMFFDNINRKVDSGPLASALTSGVWRDRILGQTEVTAIPINSLWILAGNNLEFSHELMRRMVPVRMDANVDNPAVSRGKDMFKHFPLQKWLEEERYNLVMAVYVLVRNWIEQGMPGGKVTFNSFDGWASVMGGILGSAGIEGLMENRADYLNERDEDAATYDQLMQKMWDVFGEEAVFTAAQVYAALQNSMTGELEGVELSGRDESQKILSLGKLLKKEIFGGTFVIQDKGESVKISIGKAAKTYSPIRWKINKNRNK